ncbi:MAG: metal-dependent hydrolase [Saprospiraceae bacterium]
MDSLTQITLGAAVGEVVLGRKVGNKAMLWGAIAGTFPDLDVVANVSSDEISALAFHRAITHSILFATAAPLGLGWLVHRLYLKREERGKFRYDLTKVWLGLLAIVVLGSIGMPISVFNTLKIGLSVSLTMISLVIIVYARERWRKRAGPAENASTREWAWLFFWAILTHPLLDCCTTYGTQLFQPFWDYRVAFNNVSVVDPLYTFPFLICVIIASRITREHPRRRLFNWLGIGLSSAYMLFTFYNKYQVDKVFENSLTEQHIPYQRYSTYPTIFNNLLWQGLAEGDTAYYHGVYSILDSEPKVESFTIIPKHHELLAPYRDDRVTEILEWFSNGYYSLSDEPAIGLQFNDLRFGSIDQTFDESTDYIFSFRLVPDEEGKLEAFQHRARGKAAGNVVSDLWERMKGN